ncbi:hypothetical protein TI03_07285, partial [Achromatium sp. WMS1]
GGVLAFIELSGDESLVTLGSHERDFLYEGKRYHDIIVPSTGYPMFETKAVTVLHTNAVTADAAAHALFIAGPKNWLQVAKTMEIDHALLLDKDNRLHIMPAINRRIEFLDTTIDIQVISIEPASK